MRFFGTFLLTFLLCVSMAQAPNSDLYQLPIKKDNSYAQQIRNTPVQFFSPKNKAVVLKVVYWLNL